MLKPHSCDVFNQPFFQFAQLKQHQPEAIPDIKAHYQYHWRIWQQLIQQVARDLGAPFAAPHIERWSNGWQVRAHFFAYFKYAQYQDAAVVLSVLLNRRRLTVSLDSHAYKAQTSTINLAHYHQWLALLNEPQYADWDLWRDSMGEYADYQTVAQQTAPIVLPSHHDHYCLGKHIERANLGQQESAPWIAQHIRDLLPLYESCFSTE